MKKTNGRLSIDIETYSEVDITKSGAYAYAEHPSFEILLIGYAMDDEEVRVFEPSKDHDELTRFKYYYNQCSSRHAWNAAFERVCLGVFFQKLGYGWDIIIPWECTMVKAAYYGYPLSLKKAGEALKVEQGKITEGAKLIRMFCVPKKDRDPSPLFKTPRVGDKWELFKKYCKRDVEVEREIYDMLPAIPKKELLLWDEDFSINSRGIPMNIKLIDGAQKIIDENYNLKYDRACKLTNLSNPNSNSQLLGWLNELGAGINNTQKETLKQLYNDTDNTLIKEVLELRQALSASSLKKFSAMRLFACEDGRARGQFQFYGATTGRWAGRGIQLQNLTKNYTNQLDLARQLISEGDLFKLDLFFGEPSKIIPQVIRTVFEAPKHARFVISDFSAIEARVLSWLAKEEWRLQVFKSHGKIYEASASQMFGIPLEQITKDSPYRAKGKIAELALGYQGGVGALMAMGADREGLTEAELTGIIKAWRNANKAVVKLWYDCEKAAKTAIRTRSTIQVGCLSFRCVKVAGFDSLEITLPSGRALHYPDVSCIDEIVYNKYKDGQWLRTSTYGGKLVENITQAVARDILASCLMRCKQANFRVVAHVHDEVIVEVNNRCTTALDEVLEIMAKPMPWAPDLPMKGDGFESPYYMKD